jgi:hypothetical protein
MFYLAVTTACFVCLLELLSGPQRGIPLGMAKRQCLSAAQGEVDFSDTASVASDTSESSCTNFAVGKRSLPQPKFIVCLLYALHLHTNYDS